MNGLIYIAAPFDLAPTAENVAQMLQKSESIHNLIVVSRWHRIPIGVLSLPEAWTCNMADLALADALVILTHEKGRETYTELGLHLGRQKKVLWYPLDGLGTCLSLEQATQLVTRVQDLKNLGPEIVRALALH